MNTLWLKIGSGVIGILIVIVLISVFMNRGDETATPQVPIDNNIPTNPWEQGNENSMASGSNTDNSQVDSPPVTEPLESNGTGSSAPDEAQPLPMQPQAIDSTIYTKKLNSQEQELAKEQLEYAMRSFNAVNNMPGASYITAVEAARRIITRWPESLFAFNSKLLLAKVPKNLHRQYNITPEELDTSIFYQTRAGTVPMKIKIEDHI